MTEIDVFIGNYTVLDEEVWNIWLLGFTAQEAAHLLESQGILQRYGTTMEYLLSDTQDKYRNFTCLEKFLHSPPRLAEQMVFQLDPDSSKYLIERYYEFDSSVIREILGKKLSHRNRNNLDDVSDKTRFDNVKRVFKVVEEMPGSLIDNIKTNFCLSDNLAAQYAAIVFITNNRFETGKKKVSYLTFSDFVHCSNEMIKHWSYSAKECKSHEDMDQDLDQQFLHKLRDLKVLTEREHLDEHRSFLQQRVGNGIARHACVDLDANFKSYSKNIVNIAYGLNHSKELKDIFVDLVNELVEPWRAANWSHSDLTKFLHCYRETSLSLEIFSRNSSLLSVWERYVKTIISCLLQIYHT